MRAALWLLALFAIAALLAVFAGNNQGTVTVFWPPWRIDLSLNLVMLGLIGAFMLLHAALRVLSAVLDLPRQARRWRGLQKERAMHSALLDALSHLMAGRFIRARKAAEATLAQEKSLGADGAHARGAQTRVLAHLLAAQSAHALQDRSGRDGYLAEALRDEPTREDQETREGAYLRAADWALDDHDPQGAIGWLQQLPQGAARRTLALRVKLKAVRLARQNEAALETARVLVRHRAFSSSAGTSLIRELAMRVLDGAHDPVQLQRAWDWLEPTERALPELAIHAAQRMVALGGPEDQARQWLKPIWEHYLELGDNLRVKLVLALEDGLGSIDQTWLASIETAQQYHPRDANLQYLAGTACMNRQLWGKAQQLLSQAAQALQDRGLRRKAWCALAELAEQRGDQEAAQQAYKQAAAA